MAGDEGFDLVAQIKTRFVSSTLAGGGRPKSTGLCRSNPKPEPNKNAHFRERLYLAGDEGFEPPIVEPESTALPLGQSPLLLLLDPF